MPARFVNVDRQTPMFLPCDLREWLPADHLVHFILDAVEQIPTGHFHVNHRGTGSEQYPPTMMLALLIYCYATGPVRFAHDRSGHARRRGGALPLRQSSSRSRFHLRLSHGQPGGLPSRLRHRAAAGPATPAYPRGHGQRGRDQGAGQCQQTRRRQLPARGRTHRPAATRSAGAGDPAPSRPTPAQPKRHWIFLPHLPAAKPAWQR